MNKDRVWGSAKYWIGVIGLAIIYHLGARLGLLMAHVQPNTSPVWPPTGIALAALLILGIKYWPGVALGVMLGFLVNNNPLDVSIGLTIGNTLEAVAGAYLLKRFVAFHNRMDRIQDVVGLAVLGAFSTSVSATFGVITLLLTGSNIQSVIWTVWYTWWIGDFMGALVIAPLFLVWHANWPVKWGRRKFVEAIVIAILILLVTGYVFLIQPASGVTHEALIYVIFPFAIYAALRFQQLGAVSSTFLVSGIAILGTVLGTGPLVRESLNESLILLQTFMGVVSLTALTLAATTHQRQQAEEALHQRIDDLSKINEASQTFLGIFDSPTTYQTICKVAVNAFGATAAWICLVDDDGQTQAIQSSHGLSPDLLESINTQVRQQPASQAIPIGSTIKILINNAENQPLFHLVFPLNFAGKQIGELRLVSRAADFFTTDRKMLFESYANLAAVAIQNTWLFDQVKNGNEQLHALSHRLMDVQEAERLHLSRELHDESGQVMSAMMVQLGLLERDADRPELIHQHAGKLKKIAVEVLNNLHDMAMSLRPASLDHLGLVTALEQYIADFGQQHNLNVQFETVGLSGNRQPLEVETALFRVVQESLTNVVLHAKASRVDVLLSQRNGKLIILIEDDGIGFTPDNVAEQSHLGLFGMRERVEMLGGNLIIESSVGKGTTIHAEVPCEN
jgi:signal transduction histidine kinase/integral membrane sensor domain MASE1